MRISLVILSLSLFACGAEEPEVKTETITVLATSSEVVDETVVEKEFWDDDAKLAFLNYCQNRIQDWGYTHRCACAVEQA